jgi:hypothetical protein
METTNTVNHNVYQDVSSSTLINNRLINSLWMNPKAGMKFTGAK